MKVVTFGTLKGGVGKTMLCFNIGGVLASKSQKRVLLIDSDLQGNLSNNMGVDRTDGGIGTLHDVYSATGKLPLPQSLICLAPNHRIPHMDLLPGSIFLHRSELILAGLERRETVLHRYMEAHRDYFNQYDYILIDTNPSMSVINQNAFAVSDSILLISDVSMNSIEGAQLFIALWGESCHRLGLVDNLKGFIVNDFDVRNRLGIDFLDYIATSDEMEDIRSIALRTVIPRSVRITESELAATPITLFDNKCKAAKAIEDLVTELKQRDIL